MTLAAFARLEPAFWSVASMLSSVCRVCALMSPEIVFFASVASVPATKMRPPAFTAALNGRPGSGSGVMICRAPVCARVMATAVMASRDVANNRMTVFGGAAQGSGIATNAVWVLSNANGLGGTPAWTNRRATSKLEPLKFRP